MFGGIHMIVLNSIFFFHLIEKFRALTRDDHLRKRRTTEERCCQGVRGQRIPQSLQSVEVLSGHIPFSKTYVSIYVSVVTEIRKNAPDKANDLRQVSREPQELFGPERVF